MASTPARTVRTVRLTIAFVVTLTVVLMTLRIGNSSSACAQEAEGMKNYVWTRDCLGVLDLPINPQTAAKWSRFWAIYRLSATVFIGNSAVGSPVQELESYLDKGGQATLVQPAFGLFDRSCQEEGNKSR